MKPTHSKRRVRSERGGATVEITLLTPLLLMFLLLVVLAGRTVSTKLDVEAAANDGARAASEERSFTAAQAAATNTVKANTSAGTKLCRNLTTEVDGAQFRPGGSVAVDVSCTVDTSDLSLLRLPGSHVIHVRAIQPVDSYRAVTG